MGLDWDAPSISVGSKGSGGSLRSWWWVLLEEGASQEMEPQFWPSWRTEIPDFRKAKTSESKNFGQSQPLCFVWSKSKDQFQILFKKTTPLDDIFLTWSAEKHDCCRESLGLWEFHPTKENCHRLQENKDYPIGEQKTKKHLRLNKFKIRNEKWKNTGKHHSILSNVSLDLPYFIIYCPYNCLSMQICTLYLIYILVHSYSYNTYVYTNIYILANFILLCMYVSIIYSISIHANHKNFISLHDFQPQRPQRFRSKKRFTTFGHITSIQTANTRRLLKDSPLTQSGPLAATCK